MSSDVVFLGRWAGGEMWIRPAIFEQDHEAIEKVARQSPIGTALVRTTRMEKPAYDEGRIRVLVDREPDGVQRCVGFSCSKLSREGLAVFLVAVDKQEQRKGIGTELLRDLQDRAEARVFFSTLPKKAEAGLAFSSAVGFTENGRTARGGIRLRLEEW